MAENSKIEWTDATWNPITGCSIKSPGCTNCYAMQLAGTRLKHHPSRQGLTRQLESGKHVWNGEVRFNEQWINQPLHWKKPSMIFVNAHGDLFHEDVPDEWIDQVYDVMERCPQHTFQVLTKRSKRAWLYCGKKFSNRKPLPNVWLGVSVESGEYTNRIEDLLDTPAAVRFVSVEPLLEEVNLSPYLVTKTMDSGGFSAHEKIDWVIVGGESGRNARPMHLNWVRSIRDQCFYSGVPFFFKQWGEYSPYIECVDEENHTLVTKVLQGVRRIGKKKAGRLLDGREWNEMPNQLQEK